MTNRAQSFSKVIPEVRASPKQAECTRQRWLFWGTLTVERVSALDLTLAGGRKHLVNIKILSHSASGSRDPHIVGDPEM